MERKLGVEEWKAEFLAKLAATGGFQVEWDAGHAYHTHDSISAEDCIDPDAAYDFESEEMSEHGCTLYCCPGVINSLTGQFSCVADDCYDRCESDEERIEHLEGFIKLAEKAGQKTAEWYHTDLLKIEVDRLKANLKLDDILES